MSVSGNSTGFPIISRRILQQCSMVFLSRHHRTDVIRWRICENDTANIRGFLEPLPHQVSFIGLFFNYWVKILSPIFTPRHLPTFPLLILQFKSYAIFTPTVYIFLQFFILFIEIVHYEFGKCGIFKIYFPSLSPLPIEARPCSQNF